MHKLATLYLAAVCVLMFSACSDSEFRSNGGAVLDGRTLCSLVQASVDHSTDSGQFDRGIAKEILREFSPLSWSSIVAVEPEIVGRLGWEVRSLEKRLILEKTLFLDSPEPIAIMLDFSLIHDVWQAPKISVSRDRKQR